MRQKLSRDKTACKAIFLVPIGQFYTWLILFYTTSGCDGCDKCQVCLQLDFRVLTKNGTEPEKSARSARFACLFQNKRMKDKIHNQKKKSRKIKVNFPGKTPTYFLLQFHHNDKVCNQNIAQSR